LTVASLLASPVLAAPKSIKVAVIDVGANGENKSDVEAAKTLTDVLVFEVGKVPGVNVVADAEIKSILGVEQRKQMLGCDEDASCMAELAGALGVDKVVSGSLGRIDSTQVLTLRLIDVKTARAEQRVLEPIEGGAAKFIGRMPALVAQLFADRLPKAAQAPPPAPPAPVAVAKPAAPASAPAAVSSPAPAPAPAPKVPTTSVEPDNTVWWVVGIGGVTLLVVGCCAAAIPYLGSGDGAADGPVVPAAPSPKRLITLESPPPAPEQR